MKRAPSVLPKRMGRTFLHDQAKTLREIAGRSVQSLFAEKILPILLSSDQGQFQKNGKEVACAERTKFFRAIYPIKSSHMRFCLTVGGVDGRTSDALFLAVDEHLVADDRIAKGQSLCRLKGFSLIFNQSRPKGVFFAGIKRRVCIVWHSNSKKAVQTNAWTALSLIAIFRSY